MKLGSYVKDKITGFEGILTGKASYLTGCDQYLVQPEVQDGKFRDAMWFDEGRLEKVRGEGIKSNEVKSEKNGCDYSAPIK